jgi:hypothetical protein
MTSTMAQKLDKELEKKLEVSRHLLPMISFLSNYVMSRISTRA